MTHPMSAQNEARRLEIARELGVNPDCDIDAELERRIEFLADCLLAARKDAYVIGISGGVDSLVAGRIAQLAVQRLRSSGHASMLVAARLPYGAQGDEQDAIRALSFVGAARHLTINIQPAVDAQRDALKAAGVDYPDEYAEDFLAGNMKARQRMISLYALAGSFNGLVVGTDNAAEALTGFFTKHGDGAADVMPLTGLTKRCVRELAAALGAPADLVMKTPTADLETLRPLRSDEEALGVSYQEIDDFLEGRPVAQGAAEHLIRLFEASAHKRRPAAAPLAGAAAG
ncbi:ammonia-dependent NAD(+) synthetase [Achromobacter sp. K91]|uniref:ammonia-dependent NAD(+) synthetase n=1 Tax=Achromobacter sp. K91 TaxID=2292262 RepID=UPI000E67323E|nr:ammonia-dependent NAD(+) synthetase [Achromobacter sp. K91]RII99276.1 ammonia-dependent NAD(+) synthetase [Achromobacter sp. K91]